MEALPEARIEWCILTLKATKESARSIWQNEHLSVLEELLTLRQRERRERERYYAAKCGGDPTSQCENHELYNSCWECRTSRQERAALTRPQGGKDHG